MKTLSCPSYLLMNSNGIKMIWTCTRAITGLSCEGLHCVKLINFARLKSCLVTSNRLAAFCFLSFRESVLKIPVYLNCQQIIVVFVSTFHSLSVEFLHVVVIKILGRNIVQCRRWQIIPKSAGYWTDIAFYDFVDNEAYAIDMFIKNVLF